MRRLEESQAQLRKAATTARHLSGASGAVPFASEQKELGQVDGLISMLEHGVEFSSPARGRAAIERRSKEQQARRRYGANWRDHVEIDGASTKETPVSVQRHLSAFGEALRKELGID